MPYDEGLAQRLREQLEGQQGLSEREMFGGIAFMLHGNMAVGVTGDALMVRVGPEAHVEAMSRPNVSAFDMTGRPMKGWVVVSADGLDSDAALAEWTRLGVEYCLSLAPKR